MSLPLLAPAPSDAPDPQVAALVGAHAHYVRPLARRLAAGRVTAAGLDDLVSAGMLGLLAAAEGFEAGRGLAFSTYAVPRMRGAILDELRRQDPASRTVRKRAKALAAARRCVEAATGAPATTADVASCLGIDAPTCAQWETAAAWAEPLSLDAPVRGPGFGVVRRGPGGAAGGASGPGLGDLLSHSLPHGADDEAADPLARLTREEDVARLRTAILALAEQERTVLALYYHEALRQEDIGTVLGVSESRVSQIRTGALRTLRRALAEDAA